MDPGAADPNWFYSTMSQSTAAIVGLVGAFLIQRMLAVRSEIANDRLEARRQVEKWWETCEELRRTSTRSTREMEAAAQEIEKALGQDATEMRLSSDVHGVPDISAPTPRPTSVSRTNARVSSKQAMVELKLHFHEAAIELAALRDWLPPVGLDAFVRRIENRGSLGKTVKLTQAERSAIKQADMRGGWALLEAQGAMCKRHRNRLVRETQKIGFARESLRERIGLRSFLALLLILVFLMAAGVIAPMFFLEDSATIPRAWLLVPFIAGATALLGYYAIELRRLARTTDLTQPHP